MFDRGKAVEGKACIILLPDGVNSLNTLFQDETMIESASKLVGEHQWPFYSIELNYGNDNTSQVAAAKKKLDKTRASSILLS